MAWRIHINCDEKSPCNAEPNSSKNSREISTIRRLALVSLWSPLEIVLSSGALGTSGGSGGGGGIPAEAVLIAPPRGAKR